MRRACATAAAITHAGPIITRDATLLGGLRITTAIGTPPGGTSSTAGASAPDRPRPFTIAGLPPGGTTFTIAGLPPGGTTFTIAGLPPGGTSFTIAGLPPGTAFTIAARRPGTVFTIAGTHRAVASIIVAGAGMVPGLCTILDGGAVGVGSWPLSRRAAFAAHARR